MAKKTDPPAAGVDQAVASLLALNSPDKPYQLDVTTTPQGPVVSARWKVWDVQWKAVMGGADQLYYQVDVRLDPAGGTYTFVEGQSEISSQQRLTLLGTGSRQSSGGAFRGKTFGQVRKDFVISGSVNATDGTGATTEGTRWSGTFRPAEVKDPIFQTLRELGWRPPHDSWWSRLWEK